MKKRNAKRIVTLALTCAMVVSCLSGCGGKKQEAEATQAAVATEAVSQETEQAEAEAAVEQVLYGARLAEDTGNNKIYNVWQNPGGTGGVDMQNLFRALFLPDASLTNCQPDLASGYEMSEDGLIYTITLKDGLKWSDGEALTAEDVKWSIESAFKVSVINGIFPTAFGMLDGAAEWKAGEADSLKGIAVDDNTITLTLTKPYGRMIDVLGQFAILPKHILENEDLTTLQNSTYWTDPVVCGRFHVTEMNDGNYYVLEPNPHFDGTPSKIQKIVVKWVSDYTTVAQAGEIDFFNTNSTEIISEMAKLDAYTCYPVDILFYRYFITNIAGVDGNENPVMDDVRVREAILRAIDIKGIAEYLYPGQATLMENAYPYDPEKAKALLDEAGYDYNHELRILYYYTDQTSVDFMDAVANYLQQVGIKTSVAYTSQSTLDLFTTREYDIALKGLSAFDVTSWYGEYTKSTFANINKDGVEIFGALNDQLNAESDPAKFQAVIDELKVLENENLYKLPLFTLGQNVYVNTERVKVSDGAAFGNPWYNYDSDFANWEIIAN